MEIKKNDFFDVEIVDIGINGEGIAKVYNFTIFIDNAITGEVVKIKIVKLKKNFGYGKIVEIIKHSPNRVQPPCVYYGKCGGCNLQHISYKEQLNIKTRAVKNNIKKIAGIYDIEINDTIGMKMPFNYRNKASFPVNFENKLNIGFYMPRSHDIVNIKKCLINDEVNKYIIENFRKFLVENNVSIYNEKDGKGLVRHLITRVSDKTKGVLICLVVNDFKFKLKDELIEAFKNIPNISSININFNTQKNNVILGDKVENIYGKPYIIDYIKDLKFNISALSFYQVNSTQTEILYTTALDFAGLTGQEIVFDAYCGIGAISLFLAQKSRIVYGVESVKQAVKDARTNARENNISNVEFLNGMAEEVIPKLILEKNIVPDVIVVDPPRKGCEKELLSCIVENEIKKVVYVSCDSATLARDIKYLSENGYKLDKIQPVDMFCMTTHVETCVLLSHKNS